MPALCLGTQGLQPKSVEGIITLWSKVFPSFAIDTAQAYNNEEAIGRAISSLQKKGEKRYVPPDTL